jgi:hypothetical protein
MTTNVESQEPGTGRATNSFVGRAVPSARPSGRWAAATAEGQLRIVWSILDAPAAVHGRAA